MLKIAACKLWAVLSKHWVSKLYFSMVGIKRNLCMRSTSGVLQRVANVARRQSSSSSGFVTEQKQLLSKKKVTDLVKSASGASSKVDNPRLSLHADSFARCAFNGAKS